MDENPPPSYLDVEIEKLADMLDLTFVDIPDLVGCDDHADVGATPMAAEVLEEDPTDRRRQQMRQMHPQFYQDPAYIMQSQREFDPGCCNLPEVGELGLPPSVVNYLNHTMVQLPTVDERQQIVGIVQRYFCGMVSGGAALHEASVLLPPAALARLGELFNNYGPSLSNQQC